MTPCRWAVLSKVELDQRCSTDRGSGMEEAAAAAVADALNHVIFCSSCPGVSNQLEGLAETGLASACLLSFHNILLFDDEWSPDIHSQTAKRR